MAIVRINAVENEKKRRVGELLDEHVVYTYDGYNQARLGSGVVKMDNGVAIRVEKSNKFDG